METTFLPGTICLEERNYSKDEWNNGIMPLVEKGTLEDISEELPSSFLVFGQMFRGLLKDKDGNKFYCSGWEDGCNGKMSVRVCKHKD